MQISQQILKPENRQDFESLCKKLWGEIWECPEIKKNGRRGQKQNGVDIYGIPKGEQQYFGIQCKGKDEYLSAQITRSEIDNEIKRAELFEPSLAKLYFATTANKDADIEKYIRTKNIEQIKKGAFGIDIYFWEDLVDLIKENENTYNYYINSIHFLKKYGIEIAFSTGEQVIEKKVYFLKTKYKYKRRIGNPLFHFPEMPIGYNLYPYGDYKGENYSEFDFAIKIKNIGTSQLDNFKIKLEFVGDIKDIYRYSSNIFSKEEYRDCYISKQEKIATLEKPTDKFLVPQDSFSFQDIYCIPNENNRELKINWFFLSKDYNANGQLIVNISSATIDNEKIILIEYPEEEREETIIENFYLTKELEKKLNLNDKTSL